MGNTTTHSFQKLDYHTPQPTAQYCTRPFAAPVQKKRQEQQTPEDVENEAFHMKKFEAFGLQQKEERGTIAPVEQERLGVLQAKMDDFWEQRRERESRFGFDFSKVSVTRPEELSAPQHQPMRRVGTRGESLGGQRVPLNSPQQSSASPIQAKLSIGEPGEKSEQVAERVASQVVEQNNAHTTAQPTLGQSVQRPKEKHEELQANQEITHLHGQESKPSEHQENTIIQRLLDTSDEFNAKVPIRQNTQAGTTEHILHTREDKLRTNLDAYNSLDPNDAQYQQNRVNTLHKLDKNIYKWFDNIDSNDFDQHPLANNMHQLMKKSEAEHEAIMGEIKNNPNQLPVSTKNLDEEARHNVSRVWGDVLGNKGQLRINSDGDTAFENKTLSGIAKMMQYPHGREVIRYLNDPRDPGNAAARAPGINAGLPQGLTGYETFISPSTNSLQNVGIVPKATDGDRASNQPLARVMDSAGNNEDETTYKKLSQAPIDPAKYPLITRPAEQTAGFLGNNSNEGFSINKNGQTESYKYGGGQGNSLVMKYDQDARSLGVNNKEIITPSFTMLGHELGHAARVKGGSYPKSKEFENYGVDSRTWLNKDEEMMNITGVENPVRAEHGISTKETYKTWKGVHGVPHQEAVKNRLTQEVNNITSGGFTPADIMAHVRSSQDPELLKAVMLANTTSTTGGADLPLNNDERTQSSQQKDNIRSTGANAAIAKISTLPASFRQTTAPAIVEERLKPYLHDVTSTPAKGNDYAQRMGEQEKFHALSYLHQNKATAAETKSNLHSNVWDRLTRTKAQRSNIRYNKLLKLTQPAPTP